DVSSVTSRLACAAERLVHDHALDRLGALLRGQALDVPIPVLPRAIPVSRNRREGERERRITLPARGEGRGWGCWHRGDVCEQNDATPSSLHLFKKSRIPPPPPTLVMRRAREIEVSLCPRHRDVQQAAL